MCLKGALGFREKYKGYMNLLWPIEGHGFYDIKDNNYLIHINGVKI